MSVYLGVDFPARTQTVCWCDTTDGSIQRRTLDHQRDDARVFYTQFPVPAIIGLEATGYARWFHRLLESLGHRSLVGDAFVIRKCALCRQKNDRHDAELLFDMAREYKQSGMSAYCKLQEAEFASEHDHGYEAVKHQRFVGTGYFDTVQQAITSGKASTTALEGSTEAAQFHAAVAPVHKPESSARVAAD